jgi:hypothetical protein
MAETLHRVGGQSQEKSASALLFSPDAAWSSRIPHAEREGIMTAFSGLFELQTAQHLLEKLRHDHDRLKRSIHTPHLTSV